MTPKEEPSPQSILVIRLSAMGDVVMSVHVVAALRARYPEMKITILTRAFFKPFFAGVENVEFFTPDFKDRHKGLNGIFRLAKDLGRFDLVADLHDVLRTKILRTLLQFKGSRVAVIDKQRVAKRRLTAKHNKVFHQLTPTVERYSKVFKQLGLDLPKIEPPQRVRHTLSADVRELSGEKTAGCHWIGVAPFAQHLGKIYPLEKMREVVSILARETENRIFIFGGGESERLFAQELTEISDNVVSVISRFSLAQEMELISNLDCMLCMDSSAMHMASLVGVPTVSVWGATHSYAGFYGFGQQPANIVQLDLSCRPCSVYGNKPCRFGHYLCMEEITPEMIVSKVTKLLDSIS